MPEDLRYTDPVILPADPRAPALFPARVDVQPLPGRKGEFDESWLQELVYEHPGILPVAAIEPAFDGLIRLGREVPIQHASSSGGAGFADALFVNKRGYLTLVEDGLRLTAQSSQR